MDGARGVDVYIHYNLGYGLSILKYIFKIFCSFIIDSILFPFLTNAIYLHVIYSSINAVLNACCVSTMCSCKCTAGVVRYR